MTLELYVSCLPEHCLKEGEEIRKGFQEARGRETETNQRSRVWKPVYSEQKRSQTLGPLPVNHF